MISEISTLACSVSSLKDGVDTRSPSGNRTVMASFAKQLVKWIGSCIANYFEMSRIKQLAYLRTLCAWFIL